MNWTIKESYDKGKARWLFGLRKDLKLRSLYFLAFREKYLAKVNNILTHIPWLIIDLGCNAWDKTCSLLRVFPERKILWVDIHRDSIALWKERFSGNDNVEIKIWDALELSQIVKQKVACIFTSQMMHHFTEDERGKSLREAFLTLSEWGILIISDTFMTEDSTLGLELKKIYMKRAGTNAYHNTSPEQMKAEWENAWFHLLEKIDSFPIFERATWFYPTTMLIFQKPASPEDPL